jgi:hypothetical protein
MGSLNSARDKEEEAARGKEGGDGGVLLVNEIGAQEPGAVAVQEEVFRALVARHV